MTYLAPLILAAIKGDIPEIRKEVAQLLVPLILGVGLVKSESETPQFGIGGKSPEAITMVISPEGNGGNDDPFNKRTNICN